MKRKIDETTAMVGPAGLEKMAEDQQKSLSILSLVVPFLEDRSDWNNVCLASTTVRREMMENKSLIPPWPLGVYTQRTSRNGSMMKVQCHFTQDGQYLVCLRCFVKYSDWRADDYSEVETKHTAMVFHRKNGFVKKWEIKDMEGTEYSEGPTDYRKAVLSSDGRCIVLERSTNVDRLKMLSFSSSFTRLSLINFFSKEGGGKIYHGCNMDVTISTDGTAVQPIRMNESGKFTAALIEGTKQSVMVPTFFSGYWMENTPVYTCISPDKTSSAIVADVASGNIFDVPISTVVAIFKPGAVENEVHRLHFGPRQDDEDENEDEDYDDIDHTPQCYQSIGIEYNPDGTVLAGVVSLLEYPLDCDRGFQIFPLSSLLSLR